MISLLLIQITHLNTMIRHEVSPSTGAIYLNEGGRMFHPNNRQSVLSLQDIKSFQCQNTSGFSADPHIIFAYLRGRKPRGIFFLYINSHNLPIQRF